jgi:hypothetical protein
VNPLCLRLEFLENCLKTYMQTGVLSLLLASSLLMVGCQAGDQTFIDDDFLALPGEQTTDLSLEVRRALKRSRQTATLNIRFTSVSDDIVKLSGFVSGSTTLNAAERIADRVSGVRHVVNGLIIL